MRNETVLKTQQLEPQELGESNSLKRLTVEHGIYFLIAVAAAILRFFDLNSVPLSPFEANEALAVWNFGQPSPTDTVIGSPAYFSLTAIITQVAGFSDSTMRIVPALFGFGLAFLPWFLKHRNGRLGSIVASLLLAISPTLTQTSRTVGGQSIALFAALLLFVSWLRFQETSEERWFAALIAAMALGLASAPLFYGFFLSFTLAWLVQTIIGPALISDELGQQDPLKWPNKRSILMISLMGLAIFILMSTAFLLNPVGIGASADVAIVWLGRFLPEASLQTWFLPFLAIGKYELPIVLIGIPAIIWSFRKERPYPIFLVYWLVGTLVILLLQRGEMANLLLTILPGYLLIGRFINDVLETSGPLYQASFAIVIIIAGGIIYVNLNRFSRLIIFQDSNADTFHLLLILAILLLTFTILVLVWSWDSRAAQKSIVLGILLLLILYTWGTSWRLSRVGANDTRESWINSGTDDDLPLLASSIEELSWQTSNSAHDIQILSAIESPILAWYLRDFVNFTMGGALPRITDSPLVLTSFDENPALAAEYIGSDFGYVRPNTSLKMDFGNALRWWLFHESPTPISEERVILWLRSDLVGGIE